MGQGSDAKTWLIEFIGGPMDGETKKFTRNEMPRDYYVPRWGGFEWVGEGEKRVLIVGRYQLWKYQAPSRMSLLTNTLVESPVEMVFNWMGEGVDIR